jgi:hypothetical protein
MGILEGGKLILAVHTARIERDCRNTTVKRRHRYKQGPSGGVEGFGMRT